jgi:hypothetical protein
MEYLPEFNDQQVLINPEIYNVNTIAEYETLINNLKNYIMYSRAVVLNNTIVFNDYEPDRPVKTMINNIVRNNIINDPKQLLSELIKINEDGYILLYMNYGFIKFTYTVNNESFAVGHFIGPDNNLHIN